MPPTIDPADVSLSKEIGSLSPLPPNVRHGLTGVVVLALLSFLCSAGLFGLLTYRLINWGRKSGQKHNQFIILIYQLVLADLNQSMAFLLNIKWLSENIIDVESNICWAQGWFVSTGDLASGVFCLAIAVHTFVDLIFGYRLKYRNFCFVIVALWVFVYAMALIGIGMHYQDYYMRAGAWCWVNAKYDTTRLWLHYFWIFVAEFGSVLLYGILFAVLHGRIKTGMYQARTEHARQAAKYMVLYPLIYVLCTLPLATCRMIALRGKPVTLVGYCVAGAMITSNGWLDVLLYTLTRRVLILSNDPLPEDATALETFAYHEPQRLGNTTTITAGPPPGYPNGSRIKLSTDWQRSQSEEELFSVEEELKGPLSARTVVTVESEDRYPWYPYGPTRSLAHRDRVAYGTALWPPSREPDHRGPNGERYYFSDGERPRNCDLPAPLNIRRTPTPVWPHSLYEPSDNGIPDN